MSDVADLAELHDDLRAVARDLLAGDPGAPVDWSLMASSGWLGLEVAESSQGAGATFAETAVVLEEMGRAATRSPFLGSVVLAAGALGLVESGEAAAALASGVAEGTVRAAVAISGEDESRGERPVPFRLESDGGVLRLTGTAVFVPDAPGATRLLVPAVDADGGVVLVDLDAEAAGVTVTAQPVLDETRSFAVVDAHRVEVPEDRRWRFIGDGREALVRLYDRAAVAVALDALGLGAAMLDATVAYAGQREQFGRPIGSFQAVKHTCADMAVHLAVSRELVAVATRLVASGAPGASRAAAMAKSYVTSAGVDVVGAAMQMHGGIGYTWESGIHVYLKRATLDRSLFGSPATHRRRIAAGYV